MPKQPSPCSAPLHNSCTSYTACHRHNSLQKPDTLRLVQAILISWIVWCSIPSPKTNRDPSTQFSDLPSIQVCLGPSPKDSKQENHATWQPQYMASNPRGTHLSTMTTPTRMGRATLLSQILYHPTTIIRCASLWLHENTFELLPSHGVCTTPTRHAEQQEPATFIHSTTTSGAPDIWTHRYTPKKAHTISVSNT